MPRIYVDPRLLALPQCRSCRRSQIERVTGLQTIVEEPAGTVLVRRGDISGQVMLILSGWVSVRDERAVVDLGPGDLIGSAPGVHPSLSRSSAALAETDVVAAAMNWREFDAALMLIPRLALDAPFARRAGESQDGAGKAVGRHAFSS